MQRTNRTENPSIGWVLGLSAAAALAAMVWAARKASASDEKSSSDDSGASTFVYPDGQLIEVSIPLPAEADDAAREAIIDQARALAGPNYLEMQASVDDPIRYDDIKRATKEALAKHPDYKAILVKRSSAGGQIFCPYDPGIVLQLAYDRRSEGGELSPIGDCTVFPDAPKGTPLSEVAQDALEQQIESYLTTGTAGG
ncbi:MAG TPA: hypothetical protein ENJ85_05060 [Oceanithermus profundus]|uniref:Uncharacterized protein n=1 Tax=Oceanithermus profundus TaxID=187137 RepID=A0A7C5SQU5_9DEIN|nr:hypothetical protein [Oceanithermus profundus]